MREEAHPVFEADRHAIVELKKQVRGVWLIERSLDGLEDAAAEVARGDSAAARSAITNDVRTPLAASRRWPTAWIGLREKGRGPADQRP